MRYSAGFELFYVGNQLSSLKKSATLDKQRAMFAISISMDSAPPAHVGLRSRKICQPKNARLIAGHEKMIKLILLGAVFFCLFAAAVHWTLAYYEILRQDKERHKK